MTVNNYTELLNSNTFNINLEGYYIDCEGYETDNEGYRIVRQDYKEGYKDLKSKYIWGRTWDLYHKHFWKFQIASVLLLPIFPIVYAVYYGVMRRMAKSEFKHALAEKRIELIKTGQMNTLYDNYIKEKHKSVFSKTYIEAAALDYKRYTEVNDTPLEQWRKFEWRNYKGTEESGNSIKDAKPSWTASCSKSRH